MNFMRLHPVGIFAALMLSILGAAAHGQSDTDSLFATSDQCMACHNGMTTADGEELSIGHDWSGSMMANSARDPYWQAAVRRETIDHPEAAESIEHECAACHMPMPRYQAELEGRKFSVFEQLPLTGNQTARSQLAEDGVSCTLCHQITAEHLGEPESFVAGFNIREPGSGQVPRSIFGPFEVESGRKTIMRSASTFQPAEAGHMQDSGLCGSCHTLYTHTLGAGGEVIGELPEQMPFLEWRHSRYAETDTCQDCHMPVVEGKASPASVLGESRAGVSRHSFRGGNFFMPRILDRYRDELGVTAASRHLQKTSQRAVEHLQSASARLALIEISVADKILQATVAIENLAGHKLPTAYPSRRVWIRFAVRDANDRLIFESGGLRADGSIAGNDNDADPSSFEPHYQAIDSPEKVQIYEGILADQDGRVTTGLLTGIRYIKDNRLLPHGFEKATAGPDIAVQGQAAPDTDFSGGHDRIAYRADIGASSGPWRVEAELWYQPIAYRWAENLADYDAAETNRFVRYFREMSDQSAVLMVRASAVVNP